MLRLCQNHRRIGYRGFFQISKWKMILIVHNYLDQYRVLRLFYKDYIGEPMLNPTITYDKRKD